MLPRLAQAQQPPNLGSNGQNPKANLAAADPSHLLNPLDLTEPNAKVNMSLLANGDPQKASLNKSTDANGQRRINFSITQSQFNAMQD